MGISIKTVTTLIISIIVILVAGSCLGATLGTFTSTINAVGEAWARGISLSITSSVSTYFAELVSKITAISVLSHEKNLTSPVNYASETGGQNWTDLWIPFLLRYGSTPNNRHLLSILFNDYFRIELAVSMFQESTGRDARTIEWLENLQNLATPTAADITVGGFRYDAATMTKVPYSNQSSYGPEVFSATAPLNYDSSLWQGPLGYVRRTNGRDNDQAVCIFAVVHTYYFGTVILPDNSSAMILRELELYIICDITTNTVPRRFTGVISLSLDIERELPALLNKNKKSPNGEAFVVLDSGLLIGSTLSRPIYWGYFQNRREPVPIGCISTEAIPLPNLPQPHILCLISMHNYSYPPLDAISVEFATTKTFNFGFFSVSDGTTAAIAAQRISTTIANLNWNIVIVVPEEDLFLGQVRNSIGLSVGLVVIAALFAVVVTLVLLHFLVKRLILVQEKMLQLAMLHDLDNDDDGLDEEGKKNNEGQEVVDVNQVVADFADATKRKNTKRTKEQLRQKIADEVEIEEENNGKGHSWIAEIKNLEMAYAETVRSMTNFTRYVSRAVVLELMMERQQMATAETDPDQQEQQQHQSKSQNLKSSNLRNSFAGAATTAEHEVTVLIADIEGFSSQIWAANPDNHDGVLFILHIYFKRMCRLIMGHGGVVDKFMGDSIMSYWGAPVKTEHHALLATLTALALLRESKRDPLKKIFAQTLQRKVKLRCGLSTGNAIVGTLGNAETANYSIVGAPVVHSRYLQEFNKCWSSSILMDGNCMRKVDENIIHRLICQAQFDPDGRPLHVYEVLGFNSESKLIRKRFFGVGRNKNENDNANYVGDDDDDDDDEGGIATIAFTDVLSLPTISSANQGVQDILKSTSPDNETLLDGLLIWHSRGRTALPPPFAVFAEQFSEAATSFIDMNFSHAAALLKQLNYDELSKGAASTNTTTASVSLQTSLKTNSFSASSTSEPQFQNSTENINNNNNAKNDGSDNSSNSNSSHKRTNNEPFICEWHTREDDNVAGSLLALCQLRQKLKNVPESNIWKPTNTYFLKAFRLSEVIEKIGSSRQVGKRK